MKKILLTFFAVVLSSSLFATPIYEKANSELWKLKVENVISKEKIEISFETEKEFFAYLEDNSNFVDFEYQDTCSASVEITVGVATTTFSMEGPCEGFADRFAARVKQTTAALTQAVEGSSWWGSVVDWFNSL